jgi:acyl carrier protein
MIVSGENQNRIIDVLSEIFKEKGLTAPPLGPETVLDQLGLESLEFAQAVIRMEELTGKDPFATGAEFQIRTVADFSAVYD